MTKEEKKGWSCDVCTFHHHCSVRLTHCAMCGSVRKTTISSYFLSPRRINRSDEEEVKSFGSRINCREEEKNESVIDDDACEVKKITHNKNDDGNCENGDIIVIDVDAFESDSTDDKNNNVKDSTTTATTSHCREEDKKENVINQVNVAERPKDKKNNDNVDADDISIVANKSTTAILTNNDNPSSNANNNDRLKDVSTTYDDCQHISVNKNEDSETDDNDKTDTTTTNLEKKRKHSSSSSPRDILNLGSVSSSSSSLPCLEEEDKIDVNQNIKFCYNPQPKQKLLAPLPPPPESCQSSSSCIPIRERLASLSSPPPFSQQRQLKSSSSPSRLPELVQQKAPQKIAKTDKRPSPTPTLSKLVAKRPRQKSANTPQNVRLPNHRTTHKSKNQLANRKKQNCSFCHQSEAILLLLTTTSTSHKPICLVHYYTTRACRHYTTQKKNVKLLPKFQHLDQENDYEGSKEYARQVKMVTGLFQEAFTELQQEIVEHQVLKKTKRNDINMENDDNHHDPLGALLDIKRNKKRPRL